MSWYKYIGVDTDLLKKVEPKKKTKMQIKSKEINIKNKTIHIYIYEK